MNGGADIRRSSGQYAWLKRDLASIDRGRTPWVIVAMHVPWYSSNEQHQGEVCIQQQPLICAFDSVHLAVASLFICVRHGLACIMQE